jgi:integrase
MSGKHAKILNDHQLKCLLCFACNTRNPIRDKLIVLLSVKAGLRAGEIAKLTWDMVLDPTGEIGDVVELRDCAAKKKSGRLIPINPGTTERRQRRDAGIRGITSGTSTVAGLTTSAPGWTKCALPTYRSIKKRRDLVPSAPGRRPGSGDGPPTGVKLGRRLTARSCHLVGDVLQTARTSRSPPRCRSCGRILSCQSLEPPQRLINQCGHCNQREVRLRAAQRTQMQRCPLAGPARVLRAELGP